jgi:hypothetical protein
MRQIESRAGNQESSKIRNQEYLFLPVGFLMVDWVNGGLGEWLLKEQKIRN